MQDCSQHIIIPDSGVIIQTHGNYKSGKSLPPVLSLLVSDKTPNIDSASGVWCFMFFT